MLAILLALMMSEQVHAGKVKLGTPSSGGTGCPGPNSVSLTVSPDDSALTVLFDAMVVQAGTGTNVREDSKTCSFSIPIELPAGTSLAVAQVDYRGFVSATKPSIFNHMSSDYYLDQKPLRHFEKAFKGPVNDNFTLTEVVPIRERHKSNCSGRIKLSVATRITTRTTPQGDPSMLALDSLDAARRSGGIIYKLEQSPCP